MSSVGLSVEEALGRLKFLLANAIVAAENAEVVDVKYSV